jgi:GrpB-like predicted nucleotidyltransferase (UPF0157 family)
VISKLTKRKRIIEIVPYSLKWKYEFEKIKAMIKNYIGDLIISIEHVGSTSVEGLSAKPIIDIDVVMDTYDVFPMIKRRLEQAGFEHEGILGKEGREAFRRKFDDDFMKYHLYVCPKDGKGYLEHIAFRDYLRSNDTARREYESLKISLGQTFKDDIDSYVNGKTHFVESILKKTIYNSNKKVTHRRGLNA